MERRAYALTVLLFFLWFIPPLQAKDKPEITLRWGSLAPQGTAYVEVMEMYKKYIEDKSNGRIKNILYVGGVVGDEPDMIKKMRIGQLDVGGFTLKGTFSALHELTVFGLPFLFESYDEADYVMLALYDEIDAIMQKKGFKLIELVEEGMDLAYSKEPIDLALGFKGRRVWNWGGEPVGAATIQALGVPSPLNTPVPEVLTSLQTGLLNVVTGSPLAVVGLQWYSQIHYVYDMNLYYDPGVVLMTMDKWNAMPQDLKDLVVRMRKDLPDLFFQLERPDQDRAMEAMVKYGIQVVKPDPATLDTLKKRTRPVWDELADKVYPRSLLDKILAKKAEWSQLKKVGKADPPRKIEGTGKRVRVRSTLNPAP